MQSFCERLGLAIREKNNPTVMGLDPLLSYIPGTILRDIQEEYGQDEVFIEEALFRFNRLLIDAVHDIIPVVKPQMAYYELYGLPGLRALNRSVEYAKAQGLLVILDGKRNDIGSTAAAYAKAYLGRTELPWKDEDFWDADALTINAYLGFDGVKPFLDEAVARGKGLFALVRTSNPSAGDFQDLKLEGGRFLYEAVADKLTEWAQATVDASGFSPLGAVVGATWPQQAESLRKRLAHSYILVPGYGAQGGTAADCARSFLPDGRGALVNASRSLMCAWMKLAEVETATAAKLCEATRLEALRMRTALNEALN